jgi:hypothetical protein
VFGGFAGRRRERGLSKTGALGTQSTTTAGANGSSAQQTTRLATIARNAGMRPMRVADPSTGNPGDVLGRRAGLRDQCDPRE